MLASGPTPEDWAAWVQRDVAERIARAIEVWSGRRCPECAGAPASIRSQRGTANILGRCGAGHTWCHTWRDNRPPAEVARSFITAADEIDGRRRGSADARP